MARDYSDSPKIAPDAEKGGVKVENVKTTESSGKNDPGPQAGTDPQMVNETHARHERERKEMIDRHSSEMGDMHARHLDEHKKVLGRQSKEIAGMHAPGEAKVESKSDSPKKLGATKDEGEKGTEP